MLRRKYLAKKNVHRSGSMNTSALTPSSGSRMHSLTTRYVSNTYKQMPEFGASKHIEDVKRETINCTNDTPDYSNIECNTDCKKSIVITKNQSTPSAKDHIAKIKGCIPVVKPIELPPTRCGSFSY